MTKSPDKKTTKVVPLEKEVIKVNPETGQEEVIRQEFIRVVEQDQFIQAYIDGIKGILNLDRKTDIRVLVALWEMAQWNTNQLILVKPVKRNIAERLGYKSEQIITNSIRNLTKKGILVSEERSVYYIDPELFFKGTRENRKKMIEIVYRIKMK